MDVNNQNTYSRKESGKSLGKLLSYNKNMVLLLLLIYQNQRAPGSLMIRTNNNHRKNV